MDFEGVTRSRSRRRKTKKKLGCKNSVKTQLAAISFHWKRNKNKKCGANRDSLGVGLGRGQVADGRQRQRRPIERAEVLARQRGEIALRVRIGPVRLEAFRLGEQVVKTAEPVRQQQQNVHLRSIW